MKIGYEARYIECDGKGRWKQAECENEKRGTDEYQIYIPCSVRDNSFGIII